MELWLQSGELVEGRECLMMLEESKPPVLHQLHTQSNQKLQVECRTEGKEVIMKSQFSTFLQHPICSLELSLVTPSCS